MKINPAGFGVGPGSTQIVDSLMEAERIPVRASEERRNQKTEVRDQLKSFDSMLTNFGKSLDGLKSSSAFSKMKVDSSHPELLEGAVTGLVAPGSYELEIGELSKQNRQLAFGFPSKDTPVGFGFMRVGVGEAVKDLVIDPGSSLSDVAQKINDADAGVQAMIVNTGHKEDPFRLLVSSVESGKEAVVSLDPDTTFTEFKEIAAPKDLSAKFEGVDIKRATNKIDDLIEGVNLNAKAAAPGVKVQIDVKPDVEKTSEGIKDFVKQYNELVGFAKSQSQIDPSTRKAGVLSGDSSLRSSVRKLQNDLGSKTLKGLTLASIGITTDPHSGSLNIDESKLKESLSKDYQSVSELFANSEAGPGLAQRLSDSVHQLKDRESGVISTRLRGLDQTIKNHNKHIERQEERLVTKRSHLERTYAALDSKLATMNSNSAVLGGRFGEGAGSSPQAGTTQSPSGSNNR